MSSYQLSDSLFEAVFRQAVIDNFEQRLDEIPSDEELSKIITFSDYHEARMKKLFARESRKERIQTAAKWIKRIAAAIAIAITVLFGALMTVQEVRAVVLDTIVQWFEQFTKFTSGSPTTEITSWEPEYIPDGFAEFERFETDEYSSITYTNDLGETILFYYIPADGSISVNNEGVTYEKVSGERFIYHTFHSDSAEHKSSVIWDMEGYRFSVSAYIPLSQLLEIAQSVGQ